MNKLPNVLKHAQTPSCQLYITIKSHLTQYNETNVFLFCLMFGSKASFS